MDSLMSGDRADRYLEFMGEALKHVETNKTQLLLGVGETIPEVWVVVAQRKKEPFLVSRYLSRTVAEAITRLRKEGEKTYDNKMAIMYVSPLRLEMEVDIERNHGSVIVYRGYSGSISLQSDLNRARKYWVWTIFCPGISNDEFAKLRNVTECYKVGPIIGFNPDLHPNFYTGSDEKGKRWYSYRNAFDAYHKVIDELCK